MRAAFTPTYGPPTVIELRDVPRPILRPNDLLVEVRATAVTEGDRRLRSADFPGITAPFGRLALGIRGPRAPVGGTMFAGRVVEVGAHVTRFAPGDDVFGSADHGAYAELLSVSEDGALAPLPANVTYEQAAAVPYGAGTALHFLRDVANTQPGEHVLVLGATGGVGRFALQLAKHLGADVTAVCSGANAALARQLGADHVIDYTSTDFTKNGQRYDVIFDIAGATTFRGCRRSLTPTGRYLTVYASFNALLSMAWSSLVGGRRAYVSVAFDTRERAADVRALMEQGLLQPAIAQRFTLEQIQDAHAAVETGSRTGAVVVLPRAAEQRVDPILDGPWSGRRPAMCQGQLDWARGRGDRDRRGSVDTGG